MPRFVPCDERFTSRFQNFQLAYLSLCCLSVSLGVGVTSLAGALLRAAVVAAGAGDSFRGNRARADGVAVKGRQATPRPSHLRRRGTVVLCLWTYMI